MQGIVHAYTNYRYTTLEAAATSFFAHLLVIQSFDIHEIYEVFDRTSKPNRALYIVGSDKRTVFVFVVQPRYASRIHFHSSVGGSLLTWVLKSHSLSRWYPRRCEILPMSSLGGFVLVQKYDNKSKNCQTMFAFNSH